MNLTCLRWSIIAAIWLASTPVWLRAEEPKEPPAAEGAWSREDGLRVVQHEFHSFCSTPIKAVWRGRSVWSPATGVELSPVPEAPVPSDTALQRLRQIKAIAGGFTASSIDPDGGRWESRLLSTPLYRYSLDDTESVLDVPSEHLTCEFSDFAQCDTLSYW
jgi:hypothetical protein